MSRKQSRKKADRGGGGLADLSTKNSYCPSPSGLISEHDYRKYNHQPSSRRSKHHAKIKIRPFSRQYGRKYHMLSPQTRKLLHTASKTAALPKLPIGNQPQLDPRFASTVLRLMDEIATTIKAIKFHEDYFPRRHDEREIMITQLHLTQAALDRYVTAWRKTKR